MEIVQIDQARNSTKEEFFGNLLRIVILPDQFKCCKSIYFLLFFLATTWIAATNTTPCFLMGSK